MTVKLPLVALLAILLPLAPASTVAKNKVKGSYDVAQQMGLRCQTRFGICPLIDANSAPMSLPLGAPCSCGNDPGFVIQ